MIPQEEGHKTTIRDNELFNGIIRDNTTNLPSVQTGGVQTKLRNWDDFSIPSLEEDLIIIRMNS